MVSVGDTVVSLHAPLPTCSWGWGVFLGTQNLKSQVLTKFSLGRGTLDQLKPEVLTPLIIFISIGGGEGEEYSGHYISQIYSRNLSTKFSQPNLGLASQIVSHILRVWRLIRVMKTQEVVTKLNKLSVPVIFYSLNSTLILLHCMSPSYLCNIICIGA